MDERLGFVARLLEGLNDRSRRPYRHANQLPYQVERTILGIKKEHPSWGAPRIRDKLVREFPMIKPPALSTVHAVLDRNGLVKRRKRRHHKAKGSAERPDLNRGQGALARIPADLKATKEPRSNECQPRSRGRRTIGLPLLTAASNILRDSSVST